MTSDYFTRLAGRALGKISVVQPDIASIFTVSSFHESENHESENHESENHENEKILSEYQVDLLDVAEDNGVSSSFLSARPGANMTDVTLPEPSSDINHGVRIPATVWTPAAVRTPATDILNKAVTQVDDTMIKVDDAVIKVDDAVVNNELRSERCKVQDEATSSMIGSDSAKVTSKIRSTSNFYSLSTSEHAESLDCKISASEHFESLDCKISASENAESLDCKTPAISESSFPNIVDEKTQYKLSGEESRKHADFRLEGIPVSLRSTRITSSNDILHEDTGSSQIDSYSKGEIFTGEQSPSVSSLVEDSFRVQEKDKKLLLNSTDISEQRTIESSRTIKSSKNSKKLLEDNGSYENGSYENGSYEARSLHASEISFKENKKDNISHLVSYAADAENKEIVSKEIISPPVGETTVDMHVATHLPDNEKVYSLHERISENPEDLPVEIAYNTEAQSRETISALDNNSIDSVRKLAQSSVDNVRKLAQSPIPQEQLIHVNIGRIYVKASLPQGYSEERHKIVKRNPSLSLDEYLKRRSGGSYE
ncbi:hypothetical protein FXW07_02295 [Methanosarcina sp. DH1]|uniref:hypothetical protein n=1 Tax=Methanosarcina sp. DH1 TaxID=2605695 RepID=UPI001E4BD65E|nr:hypothetical protein [Methanosarcina sp. DH1]MCC4765492.1 hypothetical protein [Methanosarcina sp. DH1]